METRTCLNYLTKDAAIALKNKGNASHLVTTYGLQFKHVAMETECGLNGQYKVICEAETPEMANLGKGYIIGLEEAGYTKKTG